MVRIGSKASCWVLGEQDGGEGEAHSDSNGDEHGDEPVMGRSFAMAVEGTPDGMGGGEARRVCGATQGVEEVPYHLEILIKSMNGKQILMCEEAIQSSLGMIESLQEWREAVDLLVIVVR